MFLTAASPDRNRIPIRAGNIVSGVLLWVALGVGHARATDCNAMNGKRFGEGVVIAATAISPPFSVSAIAPPEPVSIAKPFCRLQGQLGPSADSDIQFEVWLPPAEAWNGKYAGIGNGGFAGSLTYAPMSWALTAGYAVSGTDTGHQASFLASSWAVGHPEKVVDFGWRAIHATAVATKAIVTAYYGKDAAYSYFSGCSNGGRQGLMEAQRFPEDYDGIVVGAPANNWLGMSATDVWDQQALVADPQGSLPVAKLPAVTKAVLDACEAHNGYVDDPPRCRFRPEALLCKSGDGPSCLTPPQLETLRKIYAGPSGRSGSRLFPGFQPGGEAGPRGWDLWITGNGSAKPLQLPIGAGTFGDLAFGRPGYDFRTFKFDSDLREADKRVGSVLNATDPDLTRFRDRGGKIIQYHGWIDAAISPLNSIDYYNSVLKRLGGLRQVQSFYRLFMAPGMRHCGFGPGPNAVGGGFALPSVSPDAKHDVLAALANWVENNAPPDQVIATAYSDDDPAKGLAAQRPWCAYPALARYVGHGDRSKAESYVCRAPASR